MAQFLICELRPRWVGAVNVAQPQQLRVPTLGALLLLAALALSALACSPRANVTIDEANKPIAVPSEPLATAASESPAPSAPAAEPGVGGAMAALQRGDFAAGCAILERIEPTDREYPLALHNLGVVYEKLGRINDSLAAFQKLTALQPKDLHALIGLGWTLYLTGQFDAAIEATQKVLDLDPKNAQANYNLALYQMLAGRESDGIRTYRQILSTDERRVHFVASRRDLEEVAALRGDLPELQFALALFYRAADVAADEQKALEQFLASGRADVLAAEARRRLSELGAGK